MATRVYGDWNELLTGDGRVYYHNVLTNETSWELPPDALGADSFDNGGDVPQDEDDALHDEDEGASIYGDEPSLINGEWSEVFDASSQRYYYHNVITNATTWDRPVEIDPVSVATTDEFSASALGGGEGYPDPDIDDGLHDRADVLPQEQHQDLLPLQNHEAEEESGEPFIRGPSIIPDIPVRDLDLDIGIVDIVKMFGSIYMEEFVEQNFNFARKGIFKARATTDKLMSWKSQTIKSPLLKSTSKNSETSLHNAKSTIAFRSILSYGKDRTSIKGSVQHASKLVGFLLLGSELIRTEIYCQLCKQTTRNPSLQSSELVWQLMLICISAAPPGEIFLPYLIAHCVNNLHTSDEIGLLAQKVIRQTIRCCKLQLRREPFTDMEIVCARRMEKISMRFYYCDGKYSIIGIDSLTTVAEVEDQISAMLNIKYPAPFALFEILEMDEDEEEERFLDKSERVMEVLSLWGKFYWLSREKEGKKGKRTSPDKFYFLYKVKYFFPVKMDDSDPSTIELLYCQAKHDVVDARYPCTEQDAFALAALQAQEEFGDHPGGSCSFLHGNLLRFIPKAYLINQRESDLEFQITRLYGKLKGFSQLDARLSYLDYVSTWKIYGSTFFHVESVNRRMPAHVVLAVNRRGIIIIDPDTKEFTMTLDYANNILSWAHADSSFVLVTVSEYSHQEKLFFRTQDGAQIHDLIHNYKTSIFNKGEDGTMSYSAGVLDTTMIKTGGGVSALNIVEQAKPFA